MPILSSQQFQRGVGTNMRPSNCQYFTITTFQLHVWLHWLPSTAFLVVRYTSIYGQILMWEKGTKYPEPSVCFTHHREKTENLSILSIHMKQNIIISIRNYYMHVNIYEGYLRWEPQHIFSKCEKISHVDWISITTVYLN